MRKNAIAVALQLSLLLLVFITLTLMPIATGRGLYEQSHHGENQAGICHDKFDMILEPHCTIDTCNQLCISKKFDRLYTKRCLDSITCECTHRCRRP